MRRAKLVRKIAITVCLCIFSVCCLLLGVACKDKNATKDPIKVELSLYAGESMTLKTTYESYLLDWTSTDEQILLVDNYGKVTALKEGTATVTATIGDQKIIYTVQILPQHELYKQRCPSDGQHHSGGAVCPVYRLGLVWPTGQKSRCRHTGAYNRLCQCSSQPGNGIPR